MFGWHIFKGVAKETMTNNNEPVYSNLELLYSLLEPTYRPKPITARQTESAKQAGKLRKLYQIRCGYKGEWNAETKYFFSELIRAYGLDAEHEEWLMEFAKPTPGRKHSVERAIRIALLKRQGMTAKAIAEQLKREGDAISIEGVESYSKRRRKRSVEENVRTIMRRPS